MIIPDLKVAVELPSNLQRLIDNMSVGANYTTEQLIYNHTMYPFYAPFYSLEKANKLFEMMQRNDAVGVRILSKQSMLCKPNYFRYCPGCLEEDFKFYGETYWHRLHQIEGMFFCPKHEVELLDSQITTYGNGRRYLAANRENCDVKILEKKPNIHIIKDKCLRLAKDIAWLISHILQPNEAAWYREKYKTLLIEKCLSSCTGIIKLKRVNSLISKYFSNEFLRLLDSTIKEDSKKNWTKYLLEKSINQSNPVRNLLMIEFLSSSIEDFFYNEQIYKPYGNGPWKCINNTAAHYLEPVIKDVKIVTDHGETIGECRCSCGYVYAIIKADDGQSDKIRVIEYGPTWENKLRELIEIEHMSLNKISKEMGVSPETIKRRALALNISTSWKQLDLSQVKNNQQLRMIKHQKTWLMVRKDNPNMPIGQLMKLVPVSYSWLAKHCREWLKRNSPELREPNNKGKMKVDWDERDNIYLEACQTVFKKLIDEQPPVKITFSAITKRAGIFASVQKYIDRLPKTRDYLNSVIENNDDFRIRRVKWAIDELERNNLVLSKHRIKKKAGIDGRTLYKVTASSPIIFKRIYSN